MKYTLKIFWGILVILTFGQCAESVKIETKKRGIYYWKSDVYQISEEEAMKLDSLMIDRIYVKYFEVHQDSFMGVIPVSKCNTHFWNLGDNINFKPEIIPVIFVKNEIFKDMKNPEIDSLASNIVFLTTQMFQRNVNEHSYLPLHEIQIDCDWTLTSKDKYFRLLKKIKSISNKNVSCTLRLYPYKYSKKMGIPPVDRATLMCYNLINPLDYPQKNSILDIELLKDYLNKKNSYSIPLDVALPIFQWTIWYHNNHFEGLINTTINPNSENLRAIKPMWYEVINDFEVNNYLIRKGDQLKIEKVDAKTLEDALKLLNQKQIIQNNSTITLFHLDTQLLKNYSNETLINIYNNSN
jgi:hypothetical protein